MDRVDEGIAQAIARRYHRVCWWADLGDLQQEARLAMVEASATWRPEGGPRDVYLRSAAVKRLHRATLRWGAPVSCRSDHRVVELAGTTRSPMCVVATLADDVAGAEQRLHDHGWEARARARLHLHAAQVCNGVAALQVLLGTPVAAAAGLHGLTDRQVRRAVARLRGAIAADAALLCLLRER